MPLELIHSDVWGAAIASSGGYKYDVSFVDDYSRFSWIYLLKHKSDVFNVFLQFQAHVERLLNRKIIHVQSDWGVSTATSVPSLKNLELLIVSLAHIHISRIVQLNVSTVILLKPG